MAASKRWSIRKIFATFVAAIIFLLGLLFCSTSAVRAEGALTGEKLAIILVIDTSGSMQNTDPQMLRETASRIFIDLLSPEDFLGVITFDHDTRVVFPLERIESASRKELIKEKLSAELQPRGYTDYLEALEAARKQFQQFQAAGTGSARRLVILLTDGEPSPDPALTQNNPAFMGSYMESLWKIVEDYALSGIPIYTVAFSDEINPELIQKISLSTKGDSYLLKEPGELVVSFFKLLSHLKNRRSLVNETFHLQDNSPKTLEFQVDDYIRQINLVAVNLAAGKCELSIVPLGSPPCEIEGITVNNHGNYSMAVLSDPGKNYTGKLQAVFSGSGDVNILGDMDLYIKGWLEGPVPLSQHPLNEPLQFKVKVTGNDFLQDIPLKVEIQLKKPGAEPVFILLQEDNGYYTGVYDKVDKTGTYELTLRLLFGEQVISTDPFKFYVKLLPTLSTDFWPAKDIRLGEEVVVTGALNARGKRLKEGRELIVDNFSLVINYEDGTRETVPLNDQGKQEQGDIKRADGIWSGRYTFKKEGTVTSALLAAGKYMGSEFTVEKNLDSFAVYAPGKVYINVPRRALSSLPGRSIPLTLEVNNESPFEEKLFLEQQENLVGDFSSRVFTLEPGQKTRLNFDLNLYQDLQPRIYPLRLAFVAENAPTAVEPQILELELEIVTPGTALARVLSGSLRPLLYGVGIAIITLLIFLILGMLLYCLFVYPGKRIRGALLYYKTEEANNTGPLPRRIILGKYKKDAVKISFNPENKEADYCIQGSEYDYDIIIKRISRKDTLPFLQGWNALLKKQPPFKTIICCSKPGIMEFSGKIYTSKELFHSETFASGGYIFQYNSPYGKKVQQHKNFGTNVLEGKI